MEKDFIISGVHIGEHSFEVDAIAEEIKTRCIDCGHNFVTIRPPAKQAVPQEAYIEWAKLLAENEIYFIFLYNVQNRRTPPGQESHITKETISEMKKIAGKYYLGNMIGEVGSDFACKWPGYYRNNKEGFTPEIDYPDMETAHKKFLDFVGRWIEIEKRLGAPAIVSVEATNLNKYNAEAGVEIPMLELMCGHPEILVSALRGVARATNAKMWGTYLAHEWYGGNRHLDILKRKRMSLAYKYAYLSGSQAFCLESGDESISAFGYNLDENHPVCKEYRDELMKLSQYIKEDARPVGGPKVKVAFVHGNHDSWGSWGGSSVWNQFGRPEWGHGEAEYSWRILEELNTKRSWCDIANYGDEDLSAAPAYGMYDVIPAEAPAEVFQKYDYVIFLGWNSMTDELYDKLLAFVENGGKLMMTAAHLNYTTRRDGERKFLSNDKMEKLFGCRYTGETKLTNDGIKFWDTSLSGLLYPGTKDKEWDPIYSCGYVSYLKCEPTTGYVAGDLSDDFEHVPGTLPVVIENQVGKGTAILVTSENYPGNPALTPLYRMMVREAVTQSARECELQVKSNGALRYAVYEGGKMYLLNTDYDMDITAEITYQGKTAKLTIQPLEMITYQL